MNHHIAPGTNTIIWDLDGTLIDSKGVMQEVLAEVLPKFDRPVPDRHMLELHAHGGLEDTIQGLLGGIGLDELDAIVADFLFVQNRFYDVIEHHVIPAAVRLARRAHQAGLRQIVVTNREHTGRLQASPRSIIQRCELVDYMDAIICGDDSEHRKPKPEVLGDMLTDGSFDPRRAVVIGDQFVDALFACNLGTKAIWVNASGKPVHLDKLCDGWRDCTTVVRSLADVVVSPVKAAASRPQVV